MAHLLIDAGGQVGVPPGSDNKLDDVGAEVDGLHRGAGLHGLDEVKGCEGESHEAVEQVGQDGQSKYVVDGTCRRFDYFQKLWSGLDTFLQTRGRCALCVL